MALADNLLAYYKFDSNSNDSVGSNNGTDTNITYGTGKISNSANFNGTSSKVKLGIQSSMTTNFTIAGWVKTTVNNAYKGIYYSGENTNAWALFMQNTGKIELLENNLAEYVGTTVLATNTWYHVALVKSGDSGTNLTIYINGTSDGTASCGGVQTPTTFAYFGIKKESGVDSNFWSGDLDEFGLWDRALSGAEISQLYNSGSGLSYPFSGGGATYIPTIMMS